MYNLHISPLRLLILNLNYPVLVSSSFVHSGEVENTNCIAFIVTRTVLTTVYRTQDKTLDNMMPWQQIDYGIEQNIIKHWCSRDHLQPEQYKTFLTTIRFPSSYSWVVYSCNIVISVYCHASVGVCVLDTLMISVQPIGTTWASTHPMYVKICTHFTKI